MEEQAHVSNGSSMMTRSIRGSESDFDDFKTLAGSMGISQGAALSQLLSFWKLNHAVESSDTLRKQKGNVEQLSGLLAQINDLFRSQLNAIATAEETGKRAVTLKTTELEQTLAQTQKDAQTARQELTAAKEQANATLKTAQTERDQALADANTADTARKQAEKEKADAMSAMAKAEQQMQAALASVESLRSALADARTARNKAQADAAESAQKLVDAQKQLDAYKDMSQQLNDAQKGAQALKTANEALQNEIAELKNELKTAKEDLRTAQTDLRDLAKTAGERIDKATAEAVAAIEPKVRAEYADKYQKAYQKLKGNKKTQKHEPTEQELEADGQLRLDGTEPTQP